MQDDDVRVYRYMYWDEVAKAHVESSRYATIETIRSGLGIPISQSGRLVSRVQIVGGIYTPTKEEA